MTAKEDLYRQALRGALEVRKQGGVSFSDPINIFNLTEAIGVKVHFIDISSLEGMYCKTSQIVVISSHRPYGRQAFTCAHELGHWYFGHSSTIDQVKDLSHNNQNDPNDEIADAFASYILMPPWAIKQAFSKRGWNADSGTSIQYYTIASQLGVSYEALVRHMQYSLKLIDQRAANRILNVTPKQIRQELIQDGTNRNLIIVDRAWQTVSVDLQVGDIALIPSGVTIDGHAVTYPTPHSMGAIVEARAPGIARLVAEDGQWAAYVRVSKKPYKGLNAYRHLEEDDDQ